MQAERSTIQRLATYKKDLVKHNDINHKIFTYFTSLFERTYHVDKLNPNTLLQSDNLSFVTNGQKVVCDNDLTNKELFDPLQGIPRTINPPAMASMTNFDINYNNRLQIQ